MINEDGISDSGGGATSVVGEIREQLQRLREAKGAPAGFSEAFKQVTTRLQSHFTVCVLSRPWCCPGYRYFASIVLFLNESTITKTHLHTCVYTIACISTLALGEGHRKS